MAAMKGPARDFDEYLAASTGAGANYPREALQDHPGRRSGGHRDHQLRPAHVQVPREAPRRAGGRERPLRLLPDGDMSRPSSKPTCSACPKGVARAC